MRVVVDIGRIAHRNENGGQLTLNSRQLVPNTLHAHFVQADADPDARIGDVWTLELERDTIAHGQWELFGEGGGSGFSREGNPLRLGLYRIAAEQHGPLELAACAIQIV